MEGQRMEDEKRLGDDGTFPLPPPPRHILTGFDCILVTLGYLKYLIIKLEIYKYKQRIYLRNLNYEIF